MTDQYSSRSLTIAAEQDTFTPVQIEALRSIGLQGAAPAEIQVFFHTCKRTGLDPFARQIYMINRQGNWTIQTGIDGFRLVAQRTTERTHGTLGYEDPLWCGPDGVWHDVWVADEPPVASKSVVVRNGERFPAVALFREYVGTRWDKKLGKKVPNTMWQEKPALMLQK
ncbi:recombinase RecT, partial [Cutibacterium acnes]